MGCGTAFRQTKQMKKSEIAIRSALLIQQWYRRYRARLEMRRKATWNIFQNIEYSGEQDQLKLYNFFNDMITHVEKGPTQLDSLALLKNARYVSSNLSSEEIALLKETNPKDILIPNKYTGLHLTFPLKQKDIQKLIESFKNNEVLHARYVLELLHEIRNHLKVQKTIIYVSTSLSRQITVCGDLHGKLDDLAIIFYKNGLPSIDNPYLFNGDFVDRGSSSIEIALILFACMLVFPSAVFMNRGNHEDHIMNVRYGFVKELISKYKIYATKITKLLEDVFSWLPLATIIDNKIFVTHGGISDITDLKKIEGIDRHKYLSILRPPFVTDESEDFSLMSDQIDYEEWKQVLDLLWSDPVTVNGCSPNTFRGGGSYFGPDIVENFLKKYNFILLVRSHECKPEGYEYTHTEKVLTIFSASNYYEMGSNKGAYVKFEGSNLKPSFIQYMASQSSQPGTIKQRVSLIEESAIKDLKEKIYANKTELMKKFLEIDTEKTGQIKIDQWCNIIINTLNLNLPWRTLRSKLVHSSNPGYVDYRTCFDEYILTMKAATEGPTVVEALYRNKNTLETIFRMMDKDNSGVISMQEFEEACILLSNHIKMPISSKHIQDLAKSIDINKDGSIDFNEFLEAFRLVDKAQAKW